MSKTQKAIVEVLQESINPAIERVCAEIHTSQKVGIAALWGSAAASLVGAYAWKVARDAKAAAETATEAATGAVESVAEAVDRLASNTKDKPSA